MTDDSYIPALLPFLIPSVDDFYVYGSIKHTPDTANDIDIRVLILSKSKRKAFKNALKKIGFKNKEVGGYYHNFTYENQLKGTINGQKYDITISNNQENFEQCKWFEQNIARYIPERENRCKAANAFSWFMENQSKSSFWSRIFK